MNWTRRSFLTAIPASTLAARALHAAPANAGPRPNIVIVTAENVGAWMLHSYGNLELKTPQLDRIASTGERFINHFAATPAASASRATLLSGRIPRQHGIADEIAAPKQSPLRGQAAPPAAFQSEVLLSDTLTAAGYRCAFAGQWALGDDEHPAHGFTETATLTADGACVVNGKREPLSGTTFEGVTKHAIGILDKQSAANPFLLVVSYPALESVFDTLPARVADLFAKTTFSTLGQQPKAATALDGAAYLESSDASLRKAAAALALLDEQVGALHKRIVERGLLENTLFVFTSVHGHLLGRHGLWGAGYASNPANFYDESVHVPLLVSWPGRVPMQSVRAELTSMVDVLPTMCEAAGVTLPARNLSGRSFLTLAMNRPLPKKQPWRDIVYGELREVEMVRDTRFKLVLREEGAGDSELYDLRSSAAERVNQYENPAFSDTRARLTAALHTWHEKFAS